MNLYAYLLGPLADFMKLEIRTSVAGDVLCKNLIHLN
jgi:hypothetical protein